MCFSVIFLDHVFRHKLLDVTDVHFLEKFFEIEVFVLVNNE